MVRKRCHKLRYEAVTSSEGYWDGFGDWVQGEETKEFVVLSCRADANISGRVIKNQDGQDFVYSFDIFLDKIPDSLIRGTTIEILNSDKVVLTGEVILPFDFQEHCQVWV